MAVLGGFFKDKYANVNFEYMFGEATVLVSLCSVPLRELEQYCGYCSH